MTATTLNRQAAPAQSSIKLKHVAAVAAGNALGFYDFLTYSFFAISIGHAFFPSNDPSQSLLWSLAVFWAGFASRPVGGIVIGILGDRMGRKPAMLISFSLMGFAIVGLALTPSYASIGVASPILCVVFRLLQGFALGGEVGPTTAYLIEASPKGRRGFFGALQYATQDFSILLGGIVAFTLAHLLHGHAYDVWAWRIAFLLGAGIVPFALMIRRQLPETLENGGDNSRLIDVDAKRESASLPEILRIAIPGFFIIGSGAVAAYALIYLSTYAQDTLGLPAEAAFIATIATGLSGTLFDPLSGILSDRFGRKPVMMIPWLLLVVVAIPFFSLMVHWRTTLALLVATIALSICNQLTSPTVVTAIAESMPSKNRSGVLAMTYAFALFAFGGSAQWVMKQLTLMLHDPLAPAYYLTGAGVIGFLAMLAFPETAPGRSRPPARS
ncbi:MAG: MFS transporter [Rhizomicrobium sp.]|jgi:MFS family permease